MKRCSKCQQDYPKAQRFCPEHGERLSLPDPFGFVGRDIAGGYIVKSLVGVGGMGAVYYAYHADLDRHLAIKILLPNLALGNQDARERFEREGKLAGSLNHKNIARVVDDGRTEDGISWLAMEWIEGRTLEEELAAHGALSPERVAELLRPMASALDAAHAAHIIHRDLKPGNILLERLFDGSEQLKILDFGLAKSVSATIGSPGSILGGTPHYASPEQMSDGRLISSRSDQYSLGVMVWQMLTGRLPFEAPSLAELILLHATALVPSVRALRPDVPVAIEQLLIQMMAKQPEQRPQSAGEAYKLFRQALDEATTLNLQAQAAARAGGATVQNTFRPHPSQKNSAGKTVAVTAPSAKARFIAKPTSGTKFRFRLLAAACAVALCCGGMYEVNRHTPGRVTTAAQKETAEQPARTVTPMPTAPESATSSAGSPGAKQATNGRTTPSSKTKHELTATPTPKVLIEPVQVSQHRNAIKKVEPAYPPIAKAARVHGLVEVQVTISEDGRVVAAIPISGNSLLQTAAVQAAWQWHFEPSRLSGLPVQSQRIRFDFKP